MGSGVAVIQCGDHWENQRRTLPLALALRSLGWYPVALTYRPDQGAYFLRHGIDVRSLLGGPQRLHLPAALGDLARLGVGDGESYRGVDIDRVFAIERRRVPELYARRRDRVRRALDLARRTDALIGLLDDVDPERVYVWNGLTGITAHCLRQLCERRGVELAYLERGLLPDSVFIDPCGVNGDSALHRQPLPAPPAYDDGEPTIVATDPDPDARVRWRERHGLRSERVIFVPLQVERDTNILFHADHVHGMADFVAAVADAARGLDVTVVARRHPEEIASDRGLPDRPNLRYVDSGTVEQAADAADLVVTVNSTVGLTALLRGRPVLTLGRAIYTNKGLCTEASPADLESCLRDEATWQPAPFDQVQRFYRLLLRRHTAHAGGIPELLTRRAPAAPRVAPVNPHGIAPDELADAWESAVARARARSATEHVHIHRQLAANATIDLTYRKSREPVTDAWLIAGVARLLGMEPNRISCSQNATVANVLTVAICEQTNEPDASETAALIMDAYLQPHIAWLTR